MNAYTTREELALHPSQRVSHPEHYAEARSRRPGLFAAISNRIAAHFERQRVLGELNGLSDRELTDIGLSRSDLPMVFEPTFRSRRS